LRCTRNLFILAKAKTALTTFVHELKILPVNDCAPWIFSRFSANPMISQDPKGEGVPRRNEKEFPFPLHQPTLSVGLKKYLLPISTASFERQKAP
jgi:hypothetical protein